MNSNFLEEAQDLKKAEDNCKILNAFYLLSQREQVALIKRGIKYMAEEFRERKEQSKSLEDILKTFKYR